MGYEPIPVDNEASKQFNQIRPLGFDVGISHFAGGSSYTTLGNTKVKCCVTLLRPGKRKARRNCGFLDISLRYSHPDETSGTDYDLKCLLLDLFRRNLLLKHYPNRVIQARITIEEADGGLFPACAMGLALAFAECGIRMRDVITAVSVYGYRGIDGTLQLALDLAAHEEEFYKKMHHGFIKLEYAYCPTLKQTAYMFFTGSELDQETIATMSDFAQAACCAISEQVNQSLVFCLESLKERYPEGPRKADTIDDVDMKSPVEATMKPHPMTEP